MTGLRRLAVWASARESRLRRAGDLLAVLIPFVFLAVALLQAAPFVDDVPLNSTDGDDWVSYKLFAHSIFRDGLAMPVIGAYGAQSGTVHGFIYSYFVAGVFSVFGENTAWVYVAQSALLGASASLLYLAWRRVLSPLAALGLLLGAAGLVYVDIYRAIGFRLLSENLFLFLLMAAFAGLVEAHRRGSGVVALLAGIALGLAVLSRTNFLVASGALLVMSTVYAARRRVAAGVTLALIAGFIIGMSPLPLRELAATGQPDVLLLKPNPSDLYPTPTESVPAFVEHYARRAVFTLGFTTAQEPGYRWRPHWMVLWAGFFAWAAWRLRRPRLGLREIAVLLVILTYLGPVIAFSYPSNYGARMVTVVLPLVLSLGVMWADRWLLPDSRDEASGAALTTNTT